MTKHQPVHRYNKVLIFSLIIAFVISLFPVTILAASDTFNQFANDDKKWITGNLVANKSTYYEGMSVPQRIVLRGLDSSEAQSVTINYDFTKGGKYAYDFLTSWDQAMSSADRIAGQNWDDEWKWIGLDPDDFDGSTVTASIPNSGLASEKESAYEAIFGDRTFKVYGNGTITGLSLSSPSLTGSATGNSTYSVTVSWTGTATDVVILFSAHIAAGYDFNPEEGIAWGPDKTGAGSISGSPYHVSLGTGGSQDNQLQEALVRYNEAAPAISIVKTTNGSDGLSIPEGTQITWNYTVRNTGNVSLGKIEVTDDKEGLVTYQSGDLNDNQRLDLDETWIYLATGTAVIGSYENTGTATGVTSDVFGSDVVTASDRSNYTGTTSEPDVPSVTLEKIVDQTSRDTSEGAFNYTVTITNTSSGPVEITELQDTFVDLWDYMDAGEEILQPGVPLVIQYAFNHTAIGSYENEASVKAEDEVGQEATASDTVSVTVTEDDQEEPAPTVTLVKSVDVTEKNAPGGDFNYTLTITNTSDFPVTIDSLTDTYQDLSAYNGDEIAANSQLTINYTVQHTGIGSYINTAKITVSAQGKTATAEDTQAVSVVDNSEPSVTLVKTVDSISKVAPGTFTYTVSITNTSNAPVVITSLIDTYNAAIFSGLTEEQIELDKDEVLVITYDVTHEGVDSYENTASVTVTARNGKTATASDRVTVVVYDEEEPIPPTVTLVKTVDDTSKVAPGGTFNYTITITNTSAFPVTITELEDNVTDLWQYLDEGDEVLEAGEILVIDYGVAYTGIGSYINTASVEVTAENELTDTAEDSVTVTVTSAGGGGGGGGGTTPTLLVESATLPPTLEVFAGEIPQTGDSSNAPFAAGGLMFLLFSGLGLYGWFRKEQKEV